MNFHVDTTLRQVMTALTSADAVTTAEAAAAIQNLTSSIHRAETLNNTSDLQHLLSASRELAVRANQFWEVRHAVASAAKASAAETPVTGHEWIG